jgi:acetyl esterase/lipase
MTRLHRLHRLHRPHRLVPPLVLWLAVVHGCSSAPPTPAPAPAASPANAQAGAAPAMPPFVARAQPAIPLWSSGAPGALGDSSVDQPRMTPYLPPAGAANGTAVVIFPGGGYGHLAMDHEGRAVANWLAGLGVTTFVVQYRLGPRYRHPTMLGDAQRAIRTARARAAEWNVDPRRLGIIGFSAGGHLASTAGTHFDGGDPASADPIQRASARPDFMLLLYPVITMRDSITHAGSRRNLLGTEPAPELVRLMSNETQVSRETPPTFLVHSTDDKVVPVENSLLFYEALKRNGVPAEMHVFEHGGHGYGLAPRDPALSAWTAICEAWMRRHGWLNPAR